MIKHYKDRYYAHFLNALFPSKLGIVFLLLIVMETMHIYSAYGQTLFQAHTFSYRNQGILKYRLLKPDHIKKGKKYPLVLFFHGSGQRGDDNFSQLKWGVRQFATKRNRRKYPAFVVAPQCPANTQWVDINYDNFPVRLPSQPSKYIVLSIQLVLHLEKTLPVDPRRIYVTGLSSGGYATWAGIERMPYLFAAAIPVAGGGDSQKANLIAHLPIWAFQGGRDDEVPPKFTNSMITALKSVGGRPRYTFYSNSGHSETWIKAYHSRSLYRWLFHQKKKK